MKPNITKLYEKTPAAALATLAAGAFFRGDNNELNEVVTALESKERIEQMRFLHRDGVLTSTILTWALDCQTTYAKLLEYKIAGLGADDQITQFARFMSETMQRRIASLLEAMRVVSADCGLDFEDVQSAAGIADMPFRDDAPSIPAAVSAFIEQYKIPKPD